MGILARGSHSTEIRDGSHLASTPYRSRKPGLVCSRLANIAQAAIAILAGGSQDRPGTNGQLDFFLGGMVILSRRAAVKDDPQQSPAGDNLPWPTFSSQEPWGHGSLSGGSTLV